MTGDPEETTEHITDLIERSSFGTPEAKALRASVPDSQIADVMQRLRRADECGAMAPCDCGDRRCRELVHVCVGYVCALEHEAPEVNMERS